MTTRHVRRPDGYLPLESYGVIGDGRSVALCGADGSIDWWCVPELDSPPLFDRLLSAEEGGYFSIAPRGAYVAERRYLPRSNVMETIFTSGDNRARLVESLNSGLAGRLPWSELARRVEGIAGVMRFDVVFRPGDRGRTATSWREETPNGPLFHVGEVHALFRHDERVRVTASDDREVRAEVVVEAGTRAVMAILAEVDRPLVRASVEEIDRRIDVSDAAWREWANWLSYDGVYKEDVLRGALAMKLLLYSPSGAIAAAGTTSLPEKIGGKKNYDYRFAWVRDAAYTIKAFLAVGATCEVQAAFAWMLEAIRRHGPTVYPFYQLDGSFPDGPRVVSVPGYRDSSDVHRSNAAREQFQLGLYGDVLETAWVFVRAGNVLDAATRGLLADLADRCADEWRREDAGIWELEERRHYTNSKINCWVALSRAAEMAALGHLDAAHAGRWERERDRIGVWIDEHCWDEKRRAYVMYAGADTLDAAVVLGLRFGFDRRERLRSTLDAVVRELGVGALVYRYGGMDREEGAFIACAYWVAEAYALLGDSDEAKRRMASLAETFSVNVGVLNEMIDPGSGEMLGNMPQCLSHLAMIDAAVSIERVARDLVATDAAPPHARTETPT